jgi:uncharacterized protein
MNHWLHRRAWPALLGLVMMLCTLPGAAREPEVPVEDMILVELATVGLDTISGSPVVLLREPGAGDVVLISIGSNEALAILFGLRSVPVPRPMTHDLLAGLVDAVGARLERVMVDALSGTTYLGLLELRLEGRDGPVYVDSRPSDALALAVRTGAPILVAPAVLERARGREFLELPGDQVVTALGITVGEATPELREALGLPEEAGVLVSRAIGEAAEQGIAAGALILEVNGEVPESPIRFLDLVRGTPADARVRLRLWQDGEIRELDLSTEVPIPATPGQGSGLRV